MTSDATHTSLKSLQAAIRQFCKDRDWDQFHGAKDLAIAIITEAGELLEHFRFQSSEQVEALFAETQARTEVESEVADVLIFLLRLADRYEIDLAAAVQRKLAENAERYPVEESRGRNKKTARSLR